jgi:hypothetical protein
MALTRIFRYLHPYVNPSFSLSSSVDSVLLVLVLDQSPIWRRTHGWRISLVLDRSICFDNILHPTLLVCEGSLVG